MPLSKFYDSTLYARGWSWVLPLLQPYDRNGTLQEQPQPGERQDHGYLWLNRPMPGSVPPGLQTCNVGGLHPADGYHAFFRPTIFEIARLFTRTGKMSRLKHIRRIYCTTRVFANGDLGLAYNPRTDMQKGITTFKIEYKNGWREAEAAGKRDRPRTRAFARAHPHSTRTRPRHQTRR